MATNLFDDEVDGRVTALDVGIQPTSTIVTESDRAAVADAGLKLAEQVGGTWLLISGRFTSDNSQWGTEGTIRHMLDVLSGASSADKTESDRKLNILVDSPGGSLDSAYTTALYLSTYADDYVVYVPRRAKSASTLLALGAQKVFLSAFGELGPLDTQVRDPRNPVKKVSALDCYQSVDYVRDFGIRTTKEALDALIEHTNCQLTADDVLDTSIELALGMVTPILQSITTLDFGGWGRSLRIGERYAINLLEKGIPPQKLDRDRVRRIAAQLVFGYTHHLFPIDYHEAKRIDLPVELMTPEVYKAAIKVVEACQNKDLIGFLSKKEATLLAHDETWYQSGVGATNLHRSTEHPEAEATRAESGDPSAKL